MRAQAHHRLACWTTAHIISLAFNQLQYSASNLFSKKNEWERKTKQIKVNQGASAIVFKNCWLKNRIEVLVASLLALMHSLDENSFTSSNVFMCNDSCAKMHSTHITWMRVGVFLFFFFFCFTFSIHHIVYWLWILGAIQSSCLFCVQIFPIDGSDNNRYEFYAYITAMVMSILWYSTKIICINEWTQTRTYTNHLTHRKTRWMHNS